MALNLPRTPVPSSGMPEARPERRVPAKLYGRTATEITGPLQPTSPEVRYTKVLTARQLVAVTLLGGLHIAVVAALAVFLILPANFPRLWSGRYVDDTLVIVGFVVIVLLQVIVALRTWTLTYFAVRARDPIPMRAQPGLRVAVLTTIVPGKEPLELVMTTLRAMKRIRHDREVDVWLLDEGNDPEVRRRCEEIGVRHFSRKDHPEWNQPSGQFRAKSKHGNHNSWRVEHELDYDVVAQMDPDHIPYPNFLERSLGYFAEPDIGFVVAPQVYGNLTESFVARGSAELAYIFHGIIQRGGNGRGAPLLIGTNHLYRPRAFRQIGGYQDCIIEDHLTSMVLYSAVNPATGNNWKGVYTPDVLAVGEGPATYADFFSQQKRWAYGIWEIARRHSPRLFPQMRTQQKLSFFALQTHYPTTAIAWVGVIFLSALYLIAGVTVTRLPLTIWAVVFPANLILGFAFFQFMRRFNLVEHERRSWGLTGMLLEMITAPIYVAAAAAQLAGRRLVYVVTAKGSAATRDGLRTFRPHVGWAAIAGGSMLAGVILNHSYPSLYVWAGLALLISLTPIVLISGEYLGALGSRLATALPRPGAVVAQRRIGDILVRQRLITRGQLRELLDLQATQDGPWQRLGELAIERGYVTADQVHAAIRPALQIDVTSPVTTPSA